MYDFDWFSKIQLPILNVSMGSSLLSKLPSFFLHDVESTEA